MHDRNDHTNPDLRQGEHRLPPEVRDALAAEGAQEQAELEEVWQLAGAYLQDEPGETTFERMGAAIWTHLEAAIQTEAPDRESTSPLRLVTSPLRLVRPQAWRWTAVAAALAFLLAVGLLFREQPVTISAPLGQQLSYTLPDGSTAMLNSGSVLTYDEDFGANARTVHLEGEAFFSVQKDGTPFQVTTFNGTTTVLGTKFNVRAWENDLEPATTVTVQEGSVRLTARSDDGAVVLTAGEAAMLSAGDARPVAMDDAGIENALSWRTGDFKFADAPLGSVVRELERRYDLRINVSPSVLLNDRVASLLENPLSAEEIIRDICEYNGYKYRATPGGFDIYQPGAD